jgi:signal transduction histidine kinase
MPEATTSHPAPWGGTGHLRLDPSCRVTAADAAAAGWLGLPASLLPGASLWSLRPALRPELEPRCQAVLADARPRHLLLRDAGTGGWHLLRLAADGPRTAPAGLRLRVADATGRVATVGEDAGDPAARQLAHDINNRLTVVLGEAEFLEDRLAGQPELLAAVRHILEVAEQGVELAGARPARRHPAREPEPLA